MTLSVSRKFFQRFIVSKVQVAHLASSISRWPRNCAVPCNAFVQKDRLLSTQTNDLPQDFEKSTRTLFFGCVNQKLPDIVMQEYFEKYGELESCQLTRNFRGKSLGYGIAVYKDVKTADAVLEDEHQIDKKKFGVERTEKYRVLKIEGIPLGDSIEQVKTLFSRFGKVEEIKIPEDPDTKEKKGYCLLKYSKQSEASKAMKNIHKFCEDFSAKASLLTSMTNDFTLLPSKRMLLHNLPFETTVDELYQHFRFAYPSLREIHLRLDIQRRLCLAFLIFDREKDVESIVKQGTMRIGGSEVVLKKVNDEVPLNSTHAWLCLENVPPELSVEEIHRYFIKFGRMQKISPNFNKGFGFIRFYLYPSCLEASHQHEHVINNHIVRVRKMVLQRPAR